MRRKKLPVLVDPPGPLDLMTLHAQRPRDRKDCAPTRGRRPCPFYGCRYNLFLDVLADGTVLQCHTDVSLMQDTCALDIADRGEHTLEEVGEALGVTRERVRQIEVRAARKLARNFPELEEYLILLLNRQTKDDQ